MVPTYIPDYYEKESIGSPLTGEQNMTSHQHYNDLLGQYRNDQQFMQFQQNQMQYGTAYDQSMVDRQSYPMQQQGGAPSYASLLMNERPFLNPNPYVGQHSLLGNGNLNLDQPIYIPSQNGTDGYGGQIAGQQLAPSYNNNGQMQTYPQYAHSDRSNVSNPYWDCPGGHLLRTCDSNFRNKVMRIIKEIGAPQGVSGKKGVRVVWQGARLNKKYRGCFHKIYLIRGARYPVVTMLRIKVPQEDISKLRFICDRLRVDSDNGLLILQGPTLKSNLAKMALACMAIQRKITYCKIYDYKLGEKWVWALNPKSPLYKPSAKTEYLRVLRRTS